MSEKEAISRLNDLIELRKNKRGDIKFDTCICGTRDLETVLQLLEQKDNKINKVIEYCNETIEFKDAMNERYDDCYDILKILEE